MLRLELAGSRAPTAATDPLLNFLNGGLMMAFLLIMQYRPVLTLAKSPLIIASDCTITRPCKTIF